MTDLNLVFEDEEWLVELKKLFEGKMEKAFEILLELGFSDKQIKHLNFKQGVDEFVVQVLDLLIDDLNTDDEIFVFEKVQEML